MENKPTYEELEQRIKVLEQQLHAPNRTDNIHSQSPPAHAVTDPADLDLSSIIDIEELQSIVNDFHAVTGMVTAILDNKGKVIEATGWQDLYTKFHRQHPETAQNCTQSDLFLAQKLNPGEFVDYKCKNGLWDVVTPLYVGNQHLGNIYTGQFFYDDEQIDEAFFVEQAEKYGFDQQTYLEALRRIPKYSRDTIDRLMSFLSKFTAYLSRVSLMNLQLAREIHERKRVEQELRNREQLLNEVGKIAQIGGWEIDLHTSKPQWTKGTYNIIEIEEDQPIPGQDEHLAWYLPEYQPMVANLMRSLTEEGRPTEFEAPFKTAKGNIKWCRVIGQATSKDGQYIKAHGTVQDITKEKAIEQELQTHRDHLEDLVKERTAQIQIANQELEAFAYSVSHDLRTPLRAIQGFAEIIARRHRANLNDEGRHYFDNIIKASTQMSQLIQDLLTFSRLGRTALSLQPESLQEIVTSVVDEIQNRPEAEKATINIPAPLPTLTSVHTLLTQILTNLIENAVKYHPPDTPAQVTLTCQETDDQVILSITDQGIGIAPEYQKKIFGLFQRLHSQENYPGTGIGLALVHKAVQLLGGKIRVDSVEGQGSTFWVELPKRTEG